MRVLGQALVVGTLAAAAVAFTPACAENDQSIFIRTNLAPPQNRQNGACIYSSDPTQAGLFEGTMDAELTDHYVGVLLVGSQMIARGDPNNTRAESNRAHINGAVVKVTDPAGAVLGEFTSLGSGFVEVQQNNTASYGPVAVTAIDPPTAAAIKAGLVVNGPAKLVLANIKVFGKSLGGVDLESGEFQFPIRVCRGCLVSFASGDDPAQAGVDCELPLEAAAANALPCQAGQDEGVPCQLCRGLAVCDSRGP